MKTVLVVADEPEAIPHPSALHDIAPDLVLSCGDLPFESLEAIVDVCNVPLLYVPGNHDPALGGAARLLPSILLQPRMEPRGPRGGSNVDGAIEVAAGMCVAGLGGSIRYRPGPNQYSQRQMARRALRLEVTARFRRQRPDVLVTHAPSLGIGDGDDPAHRGFAAFHRLIRILRPRVHVHGHIHPHGPRPPDRRLGDTLIVNAVGRRILQIPASAPSLREAR